MGTGHVPDIEDPHAEPVKVFVFEVESPHLTPTRGVIEVEAPDFTTAVTLIAKRVPGVHVHKLVNEYWKHVEGGTA